MNNNKIFEYAILAEASYADFSNMAFQDKIIINRIKNTDNGKKPKPESFAKLVVEKYQVVAHYKDRIDESSFSGTLFERRNGNGEGKYVLALRGTQEMKQDLLETDIKDIVANGLAHRQIIDMYNFWQQIKFSGEEEKTYTAAYLNPHNDYTYEINKLYIEISKLGNNPIDKIKNEILKKEIIKIKQNAASKGYYVDDKVVYTIDFTESDKLFNDERRFVIKDKIDANNVIVTGHSLGGHLAAAFSRLFPGDIDKVFMFNGAGFGDEGSIVPDYNGVNGKINVDNFFAGLKGVNKFDSDNIVNITGDKNIDFVANDWFIGLKQPGQQPELFIEDASLSITPPFLGENTLGHGMEQMSDSIAIASLFAALDAERDVAHPYDFLENFVNPIMRSASRHEEETLCADVEKRRCDG